MKLTHLKNREKDGYWNVVCEHMRMCGLAFMI